jgi:hypothetical protein
MRLATKCNDQVSRIKQQMKRTSTSGPRERLQSFLSGDARNCRMCTRGKGGIVTFVGLERKQNIMHKKYKKENARHADAKRRKECESYEISFKYQGALLILSQLTL